jgi:hypothetical protein
MSAAILKRIEERRLARSGLVPKGTADQDGGEGDMKPLAGLPPPATEKDVADIVALYKESKANMESAKAKLQTREHFVAQVYLAL